MAEREDLYAAIDYHIRQTTPEADPVPAQLDRIRTLTQTARTVWFGYLGALAFTFITVIGVEDVDYFSADASTQLPLVGLSVPVTSFMWAGALLLTVTFGYLHVFLEQLWHDIGQLPARNARDEPISADVHPWLITELALNLRMILRWKTEPKPCVQPSPLGILGIGVSAFLGWIAGPAVVFYFWFRSMPAHDLALTMIIGALFWLTLLTAVLSAGAMWRKVK